MYRTNPRFWPIVLIGAGVIFLPNNLGVIQGNPWSVIWRLWPVLLIALGLEILIGAVVPPVRSSAQCWGCWLWAVCCGS
ncbi:MAG: DUF5668 domain-containing protein [Anaerolineae bacterium]